MHSGGDKEGSVHRPREGIIMRIIDYETNSPINDVGLYLTEAEVEELMIYLQKLIQKPMLQKVHLSDLVGNSFEREVTVVLEGREAMLTVAA